MRILRKGLKREQKGKMVSGKEKEEKKKISKVLKKVIGSDLRMKCLRSAPLAHEVSLKN